MRSHRTLIPFIALAVTLAANAAPVFHPLGARASDTKVLPMRRASPTPDLLEAQSNVDVDFNADSLLRSRTVEPRAKNKNNNKNRQRKQQPQKAKAGGGGGQTNMPSDGQRVPVPEGNTEATPNGGKVETAQAPPKKPQPANETNGNTHAGPSNSGASDMKGKEEPVSAANTASSDHEPKPGGLSRVNTGSSVSSTSSHSSTSSDGSGYSCSSYGSSQSSVNPYNHDHVYGTQCDPVPHQPAEEAGESKEEKDKEEKKEDEEKKKKKGKQMLRNVIGAGSVAAGLGLTIAGALAATNLAKSSDSAFKSVGSAGESSETGSESSGLDGIQFGSTKRDIEL